MEVCKLVRDHNRQILLRKVVDVVDCAIQAREHRERAIQKRVRGLQRPELEICLCRDRLGQVDRLRPAGKPA